MNKNKFRWDLFCAVWSILFSFVLLVALAHVLTGQNEIKEQNQKLIEYQQQKQYCSAVEEYREDMMRLAMMLGFYQDLYAGISDEEIEILYNVYLAKVDKRFGAEEGSQ